MKLKRIGKIILESWPFILALLVFIGVKWAISNSGTIEKDYSKGIYKTIAHAISSFSRIIFFSLWDIFWVLIICLIIAGIVLVIFRKIRFWRYIFRVLKLAALLYSIFYISWGYNYFRPKIEDRLKWEIPKVDETLFRSVLDTLISKTNKNFISVTSSDYQKFDSLVENSYSRNSADLGIIYPNGTRRPKTMIFSSLFAKSGVSGYFGPFFNEIHLNYYLLPIDYPFVLAHEKAHQFGITSEAEANLTAFVICTRSEDQMVRYSGYQSLLLYFLKNASHLSDHKEIFERIDKAVMNDFRMRQKYYQGLENKRMSDMQTSANDIYLKANKIESGVLNYDQVVSLVISWYYNNAR
jgi:hypothetical protein